MKQFNILMILSVGMYTSLAGQYELHDKRLLYYEPLHYDTEYLQIQHESWSDSQNTVFINFNAFNRTFMLSLTRIPPATKTVLYHKGEISSPDLSFLYTGKDLEYPQSTVRVSIINGTFHGKIKHSGETTYNVVPSTWFFTGLPPFHTMIYSEDQYNWTHTFHHDSSSLKDNTYNKFEDSKTEERGKPRIPRSIQDTDNIVPRSIQDTDNTVLKNHVCPVKLSTDITVWNYFLSLTNNEERAYHEILRLLYGHVAEANHIFETTAFNVKGFDVTGVKLDIQKIIIYRESDCNKEDMYDYDYYTYCEEEKVDYQGLLTLFDNAENPDYADDKYEDDLYEVYKDEEIYCLSMLITARVLYKTKTMTPILGYTNHAEAPDYNAGICSNQNTGYITLFRDDTTRAMPAHVTELVFAHEVAHAFGAYHDDKYKCSDYNLSNEPDDGYYLMNSVVQEGKKPNNMKLSQCSRYHISKTLELPKLSDCFTGGELTYCGNGLVDDNEECDCGNMCDFDNCCYPHNDTVGLGCKLKQFAECSPSQGSCCNITTCKPVQSAEQFVCRNSQSCMEALYCKGEKYGAICPEPELHEIKPDGYICSINGRMCEHGNCNVSVCRLIDWTECDVTVDTENPSIQDKESLCYMGCKKPGMNECVNTYNLDKVREYPELESLLYNVSLHLNTTNLSIKLPVGTLCSMNRGYCDVFRRCRDADPDTPLAKLKDCIKSGQCSQQLLTFIKNYWWAIVLCSGFAISLFVVGVKFLAIHTKSSNLFLEDKEPRISFRESLKRTKKNVSNFGENIRGILHSPNQQPSRELDTREINEITEVESSLLHEIPDKTDTDFSAP